MDVVGYDLGNPIAHTLTPEMFVKYRYERTVLQDNPIIAKTFNTLHGLLSAMFNRLKKVKIIDYENPIIDVDKLKFQEKQMSYLSVAQIDELLYSIESKCQNPCTWYVVNICVRTGASWSEAQNIKRQQLHVLRHSFAAHFLMNKGDILILKQILGHSGIKMTMKYAHLSPSHLKDAVTKNPLA